MVAGHPGGHGGGAAIPVVVGHSTESAVVQILPQVGVEGDAMEVVAGVNLATQIIVQVRVVVIGVKPTIFYHFDY